MRAALSSLFLGNDRLPSLRQRQKKALTAARYTAPAKLPRLTPAFFLAERCFFADLAVFTLVADAAVVSLNLSLNLNPVALYQIAKLLVIPFIASVEFLWLKQTFSSGKIISMAMVVGGVATVTVTGTRARSNVGGVCMAGLSVVTSGMQQILCRYLQHKHKLTSDELLAHTAPAQGWTLLLISPFLDYYLSSQWVFEYEWVMPAIYALLASCFCAVMVNVTQYACLGRFSAGSFQVMSHSKTILVLLGGWAFLGEFVSSKQLCGIIVAILGMVAYGVATSREVSSAQKSVISTDTEAQPLLNGDKLFPQSKEAASTEASGP